jgi:hypothetical protein
MKNLLPILSAGAVLLAAPADAQLVLRDDVGGWGWLGMIEGRRAVAQLAFGNPTTGTQGRLDPQLVEDLTARGVRRVSGPSEFDASVSQVVADCTATERAIPNADEVAFAMHVEVSYWDHTRLAATEIYESLRIAGVPEAEFTPEIYVRACAEPVADVLLRLGFTEG